MGFDWGFSVSSKITRIKLYKKEITRIKIAKLDELTEFEEILVVTVFVYPTNVI